MVPMVGRQPWSVNTMANTKVYLAGPMRGIPNFNFPAFRSAAAQLRSWGFDVFSPAEKDEEVHGKDFSTQFKTGSLEAAESQGFSLRRALGDDTAWICKEADGIVMLPGWENSKGALAEKALAEALGLAVFFFQEDTNTFYLRVYDNDRTDVDLISTKKAA